eukprot:TRINITY_DN7478_c0_g1_i1.p2 TRINITY_DN7478_c0_g1~~TRINITY_DN7478_c0_g1_i1.p2  ORF type:complete len:249 (-),score=30.60 TRINITY_DN7478_c0_g1_i1:65-715(-)
MEPNKRDRDREAEQELDDLAVCHKLAPGRWRTDRVHEVVPVHDDVDARVRQQRDRLQRLGIAKPEVAHEDHGRVVEHVEEGQGLASQHQNERIEQLVEFAEVVDVGPEEEAARRRRPYGKAEKPSRRTQWLVATVGALDRRFTERSLEGASKHGERSEAEYEVVDGWDWPQRHRRLPATQSPLQSKDQNQVSPDHCRSKFHTSSRGSLLAPRETIH